MTKRKEINDKVVEWITNKVKTEYADDISLVLLYGSYINGTANSKSDVDCYYIPKTERGYNLGIGFIIDGVGYDLFPISWERVARIADLQECLLPLVGDVQVIYCGDSCDLERFKDLQSKLHNNLSNDEYTKEIARKRCEDANRMCEQMKLSDSLSEVRKIAGHIIMTLADTVAIYNHDYFHYGLKKQYEDLENSFPDLPQNIVTGYKQVVTALNQNDVIHNTVELLKNVCDYMQITVESQVDIISNEVTVADDVNASWLAGLYEEISSTFHKIYICCESGNYILAFLSAVCLQRELDDAKEAGSPSYDLLSYFDYRELSKLAERTRMIEIDFVELITNNGGNIKAYDNYEQFAQAIHSDVKSSSQIETVLGNWELDNPQISKQFHEESARLIFKIKTDSQEYLLKGIPCGVPESTVKSNVQAHLFLGNENGMAPKLYPTKTGKYYISDQGYWFYLMEFINGREMDETPDDEYKLGQAARKLHDLRGYDVKSSFTQSKDRFYTWFRNHGFVKEFTAILDTLPNFEMLDQCFVHTDIGPHNAMIKQSGDVVFIDLDDAGIGSRYLDLGWPFIMQFVDFNHDTEEMNYRFDLAQSFLRGYFSEDKISREEYDLLFQGAIQMHISYMQVYGPYAVDSLWKILLFGIDQKEILWEIIQKEDSKK